MFRVLILAVVIGVALGGRSPHADYIEQEYGSNPDIHPDIIEDAILDVVSTWKLQNTLLIYFCISCLSLCLEVNLC
jgi:hypothetical protein